MLALLGKLRDASALVHPGSSLGSVYKRLKYCVRGAAFYSTTAEWLEMLEAPALKLAVRHDPNLLHKLQRPYLARIFCTAQRLEALRAHYEFVLSRFSLGLLKEIYSPRGRHLTALPAEGLGHFDLCLGFSRFDKEGELALGLCQGESGLTLFSLTFSITRFAEGRCEIMIGGLQGNKMTHDRDLIVALTRRWHGLRPKALLLCAIHQLAALWGVTHLRAVSDETHIYRHWRKRKQVASSYDEWWLEAGGRLAPDGIFDLPARFLPREISSLKVNKRQMYRRRYLMLAEMGGQIAASLGVPRDTLAPAREHATAELTAVPVG